MSSMRGKDRTRPCLVIIALDPGGADTSATRTLRLLRLLRLLRRICAAFVPHPSRLGVDPVAGDTSATRILRLLRLLRLGNHKVFDLLAGPAVLDPLAGRAVRLTM